MEFPVEIRLLIYNELMVDNENPYRAESLSCQARHQREYDPHIKKKK